MLAGQVGEAATAAGNPAGPFGGVALPGMPNPPKGVVPDLRG